jgi:hypothetical protein
MVERERAKLKRYCRVRRSSARAIPKMSFSEEHEAFDIWVWINTY